MACPVCGGSERKVINVRVSQESDLGQVVGSVWDGRNMARCNECGVLYDHRYAESGAETEAPERVNCPECGSPNPGDRDACTYCDAPLSSAE